MSDLTEIKETLNFVSECEFSKSFSELTEDESKIVSDITENLF